MLAFLYLFLGSSMLNFIYYLFFLKFSFRKQQKTSSESTFPVSVIVCSKNDGENLKLFIPSILEQDHQEFELILVNDASIDNTLEVMEAFQKLDSRVKIVDVVNNEAFWGNRKYALTLGIKKASHPYLLFTEANSKPASPRWISEMSAEFRNDKSIVLGYGGYIRKKHSLLNKLIRFETLLTGIQYFSLALGKTPYTGVGRNLAFTAQEFYRRNGFADHLHIRTGADELFVNQAANASNTAVCFTRESITRSIPEKTFKNWWSKKKCQMSITNHFKARHRILLGLFHISQFLFWPLFTILIFSSFWAIAVGILALRLILQGLTYFGAAKKLGELDLLWLFPFLEIFLICAQFGIFISSQTSKQTNWK